MKPIRIYRKFSDPSFPFQIREFATRRIMPNYMNIHWHPEPELFYVQDGKYEIYNENGNFTLSSGEVTLITTGKVHAIRSLSPKGHYWSISFSINLIQLPESHYFQQSFVEPLKSGTLQCPNKLTSKTGLTPKAMESLEHLIHGTQNEKFLGLLTFFMEIQPFCKRDSHRRDLHQSHDATAACIRYMETNYSARITLDELAEHVHLHPNYLCAVFKRNSGQTVFRYLNTLRVGKARDLLIKGLSVSQVAEQVGFSDEDHFSRTYKQITGISPSAYKKAYNEK